tara:strand:+ start:1201 stop:1416 length:216 start_codon:yes stop_codon:yes gene_type:complete
MLEGTISLDGKMQPHEILILDKIDKLTKKLDRIEKNQEMLDKKLSRHIDFIDKTYEGLRNPLDAAKKWLGR